MRPMPELKIEVVRTGDLLPYAGNAKIHTAKQIDQIAASIKEFGNNDPIAVWHNKDGEMEIVEGHGRLMALNKLGIEEAPVIYLDHLTDQQRKAYALVHNKLTMASGFDYEMLVQELESMTSIQMEDYGFITEETDIDIDRLLEEDAKQQNGFQEQIVVCPNCGHKNKVVTDA